MKTWRSQKSFQGPSGSNFGYSVESFQFENGKEEIIVGAPTYKDETTGQTTGKSM